MTAGSSLDSSNRQSLISSNQELLPVSDFNQCSEKDCSCDLPDEKVWVLSVPSNARHYAALYKQEPKIVNPNQDLNF